MHQVFSVHWLSQELASVGEVDLGLWQYNCHDEIEARRLVTLTSTDYASRCSRLIAVSAERKSRKQRRRVERPLLHKVLHPTGLKAQDRQKSSTKNAVAEPAFADVARNDDGVTIPSCAIIPATTIPSGSDDQRTSTTTIEDADISTLHIERREVT